MWLNIPSKVKALKLFKNLQTWKWFYYYLQIPMTYPYINSIELGVRNWCWDIEQKVIDGRLSKLENGVKLYAHGDFLAGA